MSEMLLQATLTIFAGIFVFVISQVFVKLILEPMDQLRGLIGEIAFALSYYANIYMNPLSESTEESREVADKIRQLAGKLREGAYRPVLIDEFAWLFSTPKRKDLIFASERLVGISNNTSPGNADMNFQWRKEIEQALGINKSAK